jgi:hypothetical protein
VGHEVALGRDGRSQEGDEDDLGLHLGWKKNCRARDFEREDG